MSGKPQALRPVAWIGTPPDELNTLAQGAERYDDGDDFLLSPGAFGHDFYVVDLLQRGVPGGDLVRLIRRRSEAGLLALSAAPHAQFVFALESGADAVVDRGAPADHVRAAMAAVRRRALPGAKPTEGPWKLQQQGRLVAPDGTSIVLSRSEQLLMGVFALAGRNTVSRSELTKKIWGPAAAEMDNALHAALYRLRKRVEAAGQTHWPVQAVAGVGYEFRATLLVV